MKVWRCRWCGRRVHGVWGWFHKGLRAEDVKEALELLRSGIVSHRVTDVLAAAARAYLASQATTEGRYVEPTGSSEQTPDITDEQRLRVAEAIFEIDAEGIIEEDWPQLVEERHTLYLDMADAAIAALVGFHPQPEGDER